MTDLQEHHGSGSGHLTPDRSSFESGSGVFVWTTWGILLTLAILFVARFGPDVPLWDDYAVVPQLAGERPVTISWLWSQHSEHRIPLARLILLGTFQLSGADPRPVMVLIVGLLATLGAVLIGAASSARGQARFADAFIPIALLNLGQHANFLWAIQICYVLPVVLLGIVLALIVRQRGVPGPASLASASACCALLPLCNAGGLAFIPALTLWFWSLGFAVLTGRTPVKRKKGWFILALSLPALILLVLYFRGYEPPRHHARPGGPDATVRTMAQFLGMALGSPGARLWPWSGFIVTALLLASLGVLLLAWIRLPDERARVEGLIWTLAAVVSLALGSGWGRSGEDVLAGLQARYSTLAAPALLVSYFAFACYGPGLTRGLVPMAMLASSLILLWPNTEEGWAAGQTAAARARAFDRDLAAGTPLFRLVRRYTPFLHPSQQSLHESLSSLHRAGIGKFRALVDDPEFREQPVSLAPTEVRLARWHDGRIDVTGPDPWVRFDLPAPVPACGIKLRYSHASADGGPARFRLAWRRADQRAFPADQQYGNWTLPSGRDRETTVWVDDIVSQIRIQPDNRPCEFTIAELTLLLSPPSSR
jgi:hypothetical protein